MATTIQPTVGRVMYYWPSAAFKASPGAQPQAVQVAYVNENGTINVGGYNAHGMIFSETSVTVRQPDDPDPSSGSFVEWMPFQVGQAVTAQAGSPATKAQADRGIFTTPPARVDPGSQVPKA